MDREELRGRGIQNLATAMGIAESLVDNRRRNSSKDKVSEDCHSMRWGEEVSPNTAKQEKGKVPYNWEDKGKVKHREFMQRLKCFLCDGQHFAKKCPKKNALSVLIKEREKEDEDARLGSIQLLGTFQFMSKASPPRIKVGEQTKTTNLGKDRIIEGKAKVVSKRRQPFKG